MLVLDTCALIFDALAPKRLSRAAAAAIASGESANALACCDISLWEIAMLIKHGRLAPGTGTDVRQEQLRHRFIPDPHEKPR